MNSRSKLSAAIVNQVLMKSKRRCALCFEEGKFDPQLGGIVSIEPFSSFRGISVENLVYLCSNHHAKFDQRGIPPALVKQARNDLYHALENKPIRKPKRHRPQVFIASTFNDPARKMVVDVLKGCGVEPIGAHETFRVGMSISENLERSLDVDYAIIIMDTTRDDLPRANVLFEAGLFMGRIGRNNVGILIKPGVKIPSDIAGFSYIVLDEKGRWRKFLKEQLRALNLICGKESEKRLRASSKRIKPT